MPSIARTAYLTVPPSQPTAPGVAATQEQLQWPAKAPADTLDFTLDATNFLTDAGNDTIVSNSVTLTVAPNDLTHGTLTATSTALTWDFSDGTAGVEYPVDIQFSTAGGLTVRRTVTLPVANL